MNINFKDSEFVTQYSFESPRSIIRTLSDAFSKQFCDTKNAILYGAEYTKGRCLYCGQPLYKEQNGKPLFSNLIHYDHIYPASKFNLFEVGNVALACETCNLSKSNRLPMEYYDMRVAEGLSLLIYDREEFVIYLDNMTEPYRTKWPKHYASGLEELTDDEFKSRLTELLYSDISIASATVRYNHEHSVNWSTWQAVSKKAEEQYSASSARDPIGRIGYANEFFEDMYGHDKIISDCTLIELKTFIEKLLLSKYESKNEISKYRVLIKLLVEVLNEDLMEGQLEGFYERVPTYSKLNGYNI